MAQIKSFINPSAFFRTCHYASSKKNNQIGFTLIELMVVIIIITIFTIIAIPSYQEYARRADASVAEQEIQKITEQMEKHKARNFTYRCFDPKYIYGETVSTSGSNRCHNDSALTSIVLPTGATGTNIKYTITIKDLNDTNLDLTDNDALGRNYAIKAVSNSDKNYTYLLTSTGIRCKNKTKANVDYTSCGTTATGMESW
ncbi:type IV pilin protein [Acinetobacter bereziniae]|uniref:type IV pilin protein n=1 Tax=Acinetobacter bereziniae TaxID=106648 RepID=UPI0018FFA4BB|nr:prepilin-type N-terminal cleavage/methylation domain-containing protein [Acinetobacter bereziniae]MBJ8551652.1 prepilin-type N-terminal cleavage/methylation domain-containing protein [Acinetobacter bereziniae]